MRAVRCVDGEPAVLEVDRPAGDGVRVRVASAGICGSDLHLVSWNLRSTLGHEVAGTLEDGTPVAIEPITPCGEGTYDVVIDAAGSTDALARAAELCRPGGKIVLLGTYWEPAELPGLAVTMPEIGLVPASMYGRIGASRDIDVAALLLARRPEVADAVITHRFSLDGAAEAFATAQDRAAGAIKVVLEP